MKNHELLCVVIKLMSGTRNHRTTTRPFSSPQRGKHFHLPVDRHRRQVAKRDSADTHTLTDRDGDGDRAVAGGCKRQGAGGAAHMLLRLFALFVYSSTSSSASSTASSWIVARWWWLLGSTPTGLVNWPRPRGYIAIAGARNRETRNFTFIKIRRNTKNSWVFFFSPQPPLKLWHTLLCGGSWTLLDVQPVAYFTSRWTFSFSFPFRLFFFEFSMCMVRVQPERPNEA